MRALIRYQIALLLRSQRWLPPTLLYAALVAVSLDGASRLGDQLGWNAAMLVPVLAWLTRRLLTAEPPAARACLAAAAGPHRPQLAALSLVPAAGLLLAVPAAAAALAACPPPHPEPLGQVLAVGAAGAAVCALVGSALGALCAPPLVRTAAAGAAVLLGGSVGLLVLSASPANAAVRAAFDTGGSGHVPLLPLLGAPALTAACWWASAAAAGRAADGSGQESA